MAQYVSKKVLKQDIYLFCYGGFTLYIFYDMFMVMKLILTFTHTSKEPNEDSKAVLNRADPKVWPLKRNMILKQCTQKKHFQKIFG
jgi:hypothetical protein